jgi:putative DNA primase/helicase
MSEPKSRTRVDKIRDLVGRDRVLVPTPYGTKRPTIKNWQSTSLTKMDDPEYLAGLNSGSNIGVLLGDELITIDLDLDEAVKPFLSLNPKLEKTLRTRRKRGCNFWILIAGDCPESCKLKTKDGKAWGEVRAKGNQTIIYGAAVDTTKGEKKPTKYKIICRARPVKIAFIEIRWPDDLLLPWANTNEISTLNDLDELCRRYGQPFYKDEKGRPSKINESFWAGLFASENYILWDPIEQQFYSYNGKIYDDQSVDAVKRRLSERLLEASRQTNLFWLEKQRTDSHLNSITAHLRGIVERRNAFAKRKPFIHLANGIFSFERGGILLPFSPEIISRNCSPIAFDENAKCDRFLSELIYPAMAEDDIVLMQKYFGLCLFGTNLIQRMLILDGLSARGKTQLAIVIQEIVGSANCMELRTRWLGDRFETYRFLKKTLLTGVDVPPDFLSLNGASVLKGLVGGDRFDAEQKGGTGSFPFFGEFCVIITSNTRLRVRLKGDVDAWRRRTLIVRYERPGPAKKIPNFGKRLVQEEGSGILNFALAGFALLLKDIEETGDIFRSERQQKIIDSLLAESDSLRIFLRESVERTDNFDVSVAELVEAYAAYCPERGWHPLPITEVYKQLEGLMLELFHVVKSHSVKRDGGSVRGYRGVWLKPKETTETTE